MTEETMVAETVGPDVDRRHRKVRERAERRERIAREVLAALVAGGGGFSPPERGALIAIEHADALIAELDRREAADRSEQ